MAVVVEQTIPFSNEKLNLHNTSRWSKLFPLIRPNVKSVQSSDGTDILVDSSLAQGKNVAIVAVANAGNFSSKVLDEQNVSAVVIEESGKSRSPAQEIQDAIASASSGKAPGLVIVRSGKQRKVESAASQRIEVEANGDLEADHLLHLLGHANEECRTSVQKTLNLIESFIANATGVHSRFHVEKAGQDPAVAHSSGAQGYKNAKDVAERDLSEAIKTAQRSGAGDVVYSVHYSDVNGLSRLENYILAGEIARYLGEFEGCAFSNHILTVFLPESQSLRYQLSHSTILDHANLARGFSISICAIPTQYLTAQPNPEAHTRPQAEANSSTQSTSTKSSRMTFSDSTARTILEKACNAVIDDEPTITKYDTIVGDGDCGYTLRDGAKQVLSSIGSRDLGAQNLPSALDQLVGELEVSMGGTSGALYCIFLTALASAFATEASPGEAALKALRELERYTKARVGDRTMMDVLIPFAEAFQGSGGDGKAALEKAKKGLEGTEKMEATLGRSAYLDDSATQGVPDPGAYGLYVLLEGMVTAA